MSVFRQVMVFLGDSETALRVPAVPIDGLLGSVDYPMRAMVKAAAAGTVISSTPDVGALGPIISITRNGAGDYTVLLIAMTNVTAAMIAPELTCLTTLLNGSVVVTDATHLAVKTRTDAGVATDSDFLLVLNILRVP